MLAKKHPVVEAILKAKARKYAGTYKVRVCVCMCLCVRKLVRSTATTC